MTFHYDLFPTRFYLLRVRLIDAVLEIPLIFASPLVRPPSDLAIVGLVVFWGVRLHAVFLGVKPRLTGFKLTFLILFAISLDEKRLIVCIRIIDLRMNHAIFHAAMDMMTRINLTVCDRITLITR